MALEIRSPTREEMRAFQGVGKYAFANNTPLAEMEPPPLEPQWALAAFDGALPVATAGAIPFSIRFNGRAVAADGVTVAATDPGYRRRGLLRRLMTALLERSRANDVPLSILWASLGAIYQRFGYGLASHNVRYRIDPRDIAFQFGAPPEGYTRRIDTDAAMEVLPDVYRRYAGPRNLLLERTMPWQWQGLLRRRDDRDVHVAVHYAADGTPQAYCVYQTHWVAADPDTPPPHHVLTMIDFAWTTLNGYRGIWHYLAAHDLVRTIVWIRVPQDDPAPMTFLEPRRLDRRTDDGIWMRVVDAAAALAARGYDLPGEAVLRVVDDDLCPWNRGVHRLRAEGGGEGGEVERAGSGAPDVEVTASALASLVIGQFSASELERAGRLRALRPERLPAIDALFRTRFRPTCANMF